MADPAGGKLIDGDAAGVHVLAGRLADVQASQEIGGLGVMAVAAAAERLVQAAQHRHGIFHRAQRRQAVWQLVIAPGCVGTQAFMQAPLGK